MREGRQYQAREEEAPTEEAAAKAESLMKGMDENPPNAHQSTHFVPVGGQHSVPVV